MTQALTTTTTNAVAARAVTPAPSAARTMDALLTRSGVADPIPQGPLAGYSRAMVETIKGSVAKGAPDEQLFMFFTICAQHNLNPFLKEAWCINMAGPNQTPQWMVAPSRDGYLRAARRHPNVKSITSGVVHDGDDYAIDKVNGNVKHLVAGMKAKPGPILGAWCLVVLHDGTRIADDVYLSDVKRGSPVWNNFEAQMTEKCAQSKVLKKGVGLSDLYTADKVWEAIDDDSATALLVNPEQAEYFDGFVVGSAAPELSAGKPAAADAGRGDRNDAVKALNGRIKAISETVDGANPGDAQDARTTWLKAVGHGPLSKIEGADPVWELVDLLQSEDGTSHFAELLTAARDARLAVPVATADANIVLPSDDDVPPFNAEPDADEAARILAREQAEAREVV